MYTMQNIFSSFLCFAIFFITQVWHWANLNCKEENKTSDIRYHEITVTILQIGTRDKRKRGRGQYPKIASFKSSAKIANMRFLRMVFLIIIMCLFHVKGIDCVKDLIKRKPLTKLSVITDIKTSSFGKCAIIYGCFSSRQNQFPKGNNRLRLWTSSW